jgi:KaiC/GvpD/RAD55 family RecA-like ATPase
LTINTTQLELNAIKKIMEARDPELLVKVTPAMFGNEELGKLFRLIKHHYVNNSTWVGWDVLRSIVAQKASTVDKANYILALIDQIQARDVAGFSKEMLVEELTGLGKVRTLLDGIQEVVSAAEAKDSEQALALFFSLYEKVAISGNDSVLSADLLSLAGADVKFNWRTTGIAAIDRRNGVATGSLVLLCGDTGTGKSTQAHSIAIHQYNKYGEGVAYWSWEQGKKEIMARVWSHQADVDLGNIISDELEPHDRATVRKAKLKFLFHYDEVEMDKFVVENSHLNEEMFVRAAADKFERKSNGFYIFDHGPDFDQLMVEMELLRSTKGVKVFVVDYLTIVPPGVDHRKLQSWECYIKMSQKLKNFARRHDVIVITPLQFDSSEGKIRFSKNIINDADLALFMYQDKDDKEVGSVTNEFAKYRNFKSIPNEPLSPFKQLRAFDKAKFLEISF